MGGLVGGALFGKREFFERSKSEHWKAFLRHL